MGKSKLHDWYVPYCVRLNESVAKIYAAGVKYAVNGFSLRLQRLKGCFLAVYTQMKATVSSITKRVCSVLRTIRGYFCESSVLRVG